MFGTVARLQPKTGQEHAVIELMNEWREEQRPRLKDLNGEVHGYVLRSERRPGELLLVALFPDREAFQANAQTPEQDQWYQRLRGHLEHDPIWEDGEIVAVT